jgi:hypothetical protein
MKDMLETDFGVPGVWSEDALRSTWENAVYTDRLRQPAYQDSGTRQPTLAFAAGNMGVRADRLCRASLASPSAWRTRHVRGSLPSIDGW